MRIFINDILTSSKERFIYNAEFERDACEIDGRKVTFHQKPMVVCDITKKGNNDLYASIDVHLDTTLNCVRCLGDMDVVEDVNIAGIISKEDFDSDYDIILTDGDYLDLDKIVDDAVFEHLINNSFCKEDCKGLCHKCGTNLNVGTCKCEEENPNIDPRLEQLKTFLDSNI